MSRPIDPTKRDSNGEYLSRKNYWKSTNKDGGGEKQKVTLYLTTQDRKLMTRLGKRLKVEGHSAIVRKAVEMALEVGKI